MPYQPGLGSDVVILNDAGELSPKFAARGRRTRRKERVSIEIIAEPLLHDFSEHLLGAKPAEAIREHLTAAIKGITAKASTATIRKREQAARAFQRGAKWATKRYSGGRTGPKPPNQSDRLFGDSNRLAEGLFVRENRVDSSWTVNVPANRFDRSTFTGAAFENMLNKLRSLVPALQDVTQLLRDPKVDEAIESSIHDIITKASPGDQGRLQQLARARRQALLAGLRLVQGAVTGR